MIKKAVILPGLLLIMIMGTAIYGEKEPQFIFNWPIPCQFSIIEKVVKKGKDARIQYKIRVDPTQDPKILKVIWAEVRFQEINGIAIDSLQMRKMIEAQLGSQEALYANFLINTKGEFLEVDNVEEKMAEYIKIIKKVSKDLAMVEKALNSINPEMFKAIITNAAKNKWLAWVEAWQEYPVPEGKSLTVDIEELVLGRIPMKMNATYSNLGKSKKYPGCVHLKVIGKPDEAEVKRVINTLMKQLGSQEVKQEKFKEMEGFTLNVNTMQEIIIDPLTLKPFWGYTEKDIEFSGPGIKGVKALESHEYQFIWSR
jgi:hypothetical protein